MTQSELWLAKWQEAVDFLETNHRKPSKFVPEERNMRSWWKHNKKLMNAGELKPERLEMFKQLLELGEKQPKKVERVFYEMGVSVIWYVKSSEIPGLVRTITQNASLPRLGFESDN